jgi:hypothetical protein
VKFFMAYDAAATARRVVTPVVILQAEAGSPVCDGPHILRDESCFSRRRQRRVLRFGEKSSLRHIAESGRAAGGAWRDRGLVERTIPVMHSCRANAFLMGENVFSLRCSNRFSWEKRPVTRVSAGRFVVILRGRIGVSHRGKVQFPYCVLRR